MYQKKADRNFNVSRESERSFYTMYASVAEAMHTATGCFDIAPSNSTEERALHLCMAPGGYTAQLLDTNPRIKVFGITLPESLGGHPILIKDERVTIEYLDMNLLHSEFDVSLAPSPEHPDHKMFVQQTVFGDLEFDLVFGDGAVLPPNSGERSRIKKEIEAFRLRLAQLVFGLKRMKKGGTFVLLLHRIDSFENLSLLKAFEKFSKVQVYKPTTNFAYTTSFYLIAKDVQRGHEVAQGLIEEWKVMWQKATFGVGEVNLPAEASRETVRRALEEYGPRLVELGDRIWAIQAESLSKAAYLQPRSQQNLPSQRSPAWRVTQQASPGRENRPPALSMASWRRKE